MAVRRLRLSLTVAALLLALALLVAVAGPAALMLTPAAALALPLLLGRYIGADALARLGRGPCPGAARRRAALPRAPRDVGGHRWQLALAGGSRGPPARVAT